MSEEKKRCGTCEYCRELEMRFPVVEETRGARPLIMLNWETKEGKACCYETPAKGIYRPWVKENEVCRRWSARETKEKPSSHREPLRMLDFIKRAHNIRSENPNALVMPVTRSENEQYRKILVPPADPSMNAIPLSCNGLTLVWRPEDDG